MVKRMLDDSAKGAHGARRQQCKRRFNADDKQAIVLRGGRRGLVICTRQWGKSTMMAVKAVHRAYTEAGSLTLALTPSARQSGEFLRKAEAFVQRLGIKVRGDGVNEISIAFPNGSRLESQPLLRKFH